ncbi:glycine cleavage system protein R [Hippea jasoniae]|uniref:glycine cleavage system protein R n=1 Tax=Hippea jasoniae TaxID=944479 RepID=UPI0005587ED1|nr:ACT domain-containing protein [Hippea jasoniae]
MSEKYLYALTVIGEDKPGIVAAVAEVLYEKHINIEDSVSTLLGNQFTMTLLVKSSKNYGVLELKKAFAKARGKLKLSVSLRRIEESELTTKQPQNLYSISVYGADKVGIVYFVSKALAEHNINILDLRTRLTKSEKPMYVMILEVDVPDGISENALNDIIKDVCLKLDVDYSIRKIESYEL